MLALLAGLGDERLVDVGDDTTRGNRGLDEDVKLLVSTDGKLEMTGSHTLHLEVTGSVASKLKNLSSQVLQNSSHVHSSSGTDTPRGSRPLLQVRVNTSDRELQQHNMSIKGHTEEKKGKGEMKKKLTRLFGAKKKPKQKRATLSPKPLFLSPLGSTHTVCISRGGKR